MLRNFPSSSDSFDSFLHSAQPGPLIYSYPLPVADPFELYCRLSLTSGPSFFLESGKGDLGVGRYSFLGSDPYLVFSGKGDTYEIYTEGTRVTREGDPFSAFIELLGQSPPMAGGPNWPPFLGGAVGFLSYDLVRRFETLPRMAVDDLPLPDLQFLFVDLLAAVDHHTQTLHLVFAPCRERLLGESRDRLFREGRERLAELKSRLSAPLRWSPGDFSGIFPATVRGEQSKNDYVDRVRECLAFIGAGDIYQANLSHRFRVDLPDVTGEWSRVQGPLFYQRVREMNPSPFSALLVMDNCTFVSSSPERLVRLQGQWADTRPIAGTRPRGSTLAEDRRLAEDLLSNVKERAEHLMLVDLARNDLGRVARIGTVRVEEFMTVERYSHVAHLVSNVAGVLKDGLYAADLIRAVFPGGTVTGVPKIHCMEIIEQLEPVRRGPYTGSIGYISWTGDMDLNIIIRTLLLTGGKGYIQVGAGIVADSIPEQEYEETLYKAQSFFQAFK